MHPRGITLLTTMLVVLALSLMIAGSLMFTGQESSSAAQHARREGLASCLKSARSMVLAQVRLGALGRGTNASINFTQDLGNYTIQTAHVQDGLSAGPVVSDCSSSLNTQRVDITNITLQKDYSQCYRWVARCIDNETKAQGEIEFQVSLAL